MKINFQEDITFNTKEVLETSFNNETLIFKKYFKYDGPITMQYLPNGGIQSLFKGLLIIKVNNGFLAVEEVIYKNEELSSKEFIEKVGEINLINQVLPN